jgi:hypothetical protein
MQRNIESENDTIYHETDKTGMVNYKLPKAS